MDTNQESCPKRLLRMYADEDCDNGLSNAARALGMSRQRLYGWVKKGYIPPMQAPDVERITGGKIKTLEIVEEANAVLKLTRG